MMLTVLTKATAVALAARALGKEIRRGQQFERTLGYRGGSEENTVHWHRGAGVWGVQERGPNRFWQVFGLRNPEMWRKSSIVVEINPPLSGINRKIGGVFLSDGKAMFLGHRGTHINQVPMAAFEKHFRGGAAGRWVRVVDGDKETELVLLGRVDRRQIIAAITAFAREVKRIKKLVRPDMTSRG
jgi:hypothetical protein